LNTKITDFRVEPLESGRFVKPKLVNYTQDGVAKTWEIVEVDDSVAILIFNPKKEKFIFVRQFRPALFKKDNSGITLELCAGIVDKDLSLAEIASEEILEECGYKVEPENLEKITSFYTAVGFAGSKQTLFYAEVDDNQRVSEGGGIDAEKIEIVEIDRAKILETLYDESIPKTAGLCFAINWHLSNR
jgi:UDP-sugar diphosphatase